MLEISADVDASPDEVEGALEELVRIGEVAWSVRLTEYPEDVIGEEGLTGGTDSGIVRA